MVENEEINDSYSDREKRKKKAKLRPRVKRNETGDEWVRTYPLHTILKTGTNLAL